MTAPGVRAGEDAHDLDVEEALALVKRPHGRTPDRASGDQAPAPQDPQLAAQGTAAAAPRPDAHHRATPWPQARATAERAGRTARATAERARRGRRPCTDRRHDAPPAPLPPPPCPSTPPWRAGRSQPPLADAGVDRGVTSTPRR
ncbi:hypothetical protein SGLAM104S_02053 [Streptomyces glaucescens]